MGRFVLVAIIVLTAVFCIGLLFSSQSLGTSPEEGATPGQAQSAVPARPVDYAVLGLLVGGGFIDLLRPKRRPTVQEPRRER